MDWSNLINQIINLISGSTPTDPSFDGTQLTLQRKSHDQFCTQSDFSINGIFTCYTIELPKEHENQANIRIPAGTYPVSLYQGSRWPFKTPLLDTSAIGRNFIEFHPSNFAIRPSDLKVFLEGCIAPGLTKGQDYENSSLDAFKLVMSKIDWTKKVQITIIDED